LQGLGEGRCPPILGFITFLLTSILKFAWGEGGLYSPSSLLCASMVNAIFQVQGNSTNNFNSFPELDTPSVVIEYLPFEKDDVLPGEISK